MKKHRVIFVAIFVISTLLSAKVFSQQTEGSVKYLTTFDWVKMMNSCDYLSKEAREKAAYMWGNRSEWKVYNNLYFSAQKSKYDESEEKAEPDQEGYNWRKEIFFITRNYDQKVYYNAIELLGKLYLISDSLVTPNWKILNDIKEIGGHVCMNASLNDTLMNQKVVAWFALDIPVPAGPDRFFGLPGLILEVNINNGAKIMTAEKVELKTLTTEFDLPKKLKGKQITGTAYEAMIKKFLDEKRKAEEFPWGLRY
ncbi:MAG: GLPGLI family protein [Bacteroidota bacterium]